MGAVHQGSTPALRATPAVEAQAIDRTHRIGQTRQVFAYRLIARNTVEEKVLQLQESKRNLADAIYPRRQQPDP